MKYAIFSMGHSYMLVDIDCLSLDSPFYADLTPDDPLFSSVHTQWPPFFHFCEEFYVHIRDFRGVLCVHFEKTIDFTAILTKKLKILAWNYIEWTPYLESTSKHTPFFFLLSLHQITPFFHEILHRMPSTFVLRKAHRRHFHIRVPRPAPAPHTY